MTVLLYAITAASAPEPGGAGLEAAPLRGVEAPPLRALVSDHDAPPAPHAETLYAYAGVLERLMRATTIIPARFGTVAEDDAAIRSTLLARGEELLGTLARVRGAVELAVHAPGGADGSAAPARTGADYLRNRLQQRRRGEQLEQATAGLFRERAELPGARSTGYLVDLTEVERFTAAAAAAGGTVTGPWPPFSFVR